MTATLIGKRNAYSHLRTRWIEAFHLKEFHLNLPRKFYSSLYPTNFAPKIQLQVFFLHACFINKTMLILSLRHFNRPIRRLTKNSMELKQRRQRHRGRRLVKNKFTFYKRNSRFSRSVQYVGSISAALSGVRGRSAGSFPEQRLSGNRAYSVRQ